MADLLYFATLFAFAGAAVMVIACALLLGSWAREAIATAVAISIAVLVAILPSALHTVFGISTATPWFTWYRIGSDALIGVVEVWRASAIYRIQRRGTSSSLPKQNGDAAEL